MPLSAQGIAARWLLLATAASTTLLHLVKADDNFTDTVAGTDFDWLNATQLLPMFEYENNTEGNSTEGDVDVAAALENYSVGENITDVDTALENYSVGENITDVAAALENYSVGENITDVDAALENYSVGENITDVDAALENYSVGENITDVAAALENYSVGENITDVDTALENYSVGENITDVDAALENYSVGENITDVDAALENYSVGENITDVDAALENYSVGENITDVDASLENYSVGENITDVDAALENYSVGENITEESNRSSPDDSPFEMLRKHRHYARFVFMVVILHVAVVGVCITIYSLVHCKVRTLKKRKRAEAQRILRLTNLQFQHVPNSSDCPCDGCIVAREMLQGLILQQMQELVEC